MRVHEISILELKFTEWNGFHFSVLNLEIGDLDSALFGVYVSNTVFYIDLLYFTIKIKCPFLK